MTKMRFKKGHGIAMLMAAVLAFTACNNAVGTASGEAGIALNAARANVRQPDFDVPSTDYPTLQDAFDEIEADSTETDFSITLTDDVSSGPIDVTAGGFAGKTITLTDGAGIYTVTLNTGGVLFTVGDRPTVNNPVTFTITGDVTLVGVSNNRNAFVRVNNGGIINLTGNAKLTGNTNTAGFGGAVMIYGGIFNMNGNSEIYGNTTSSSSGTSYGGGVYISQETGVLNLSGAASIHDNTSITTDGKAGGGGVKVDYSAVFNMSGGSVSKNTITTTYTGGTVFGGGVYVSVHASTFNMTGGVISGNQVVYPDDITNTNAGGGGVCVDTDFWGDGVTLNKTNEGGIIYGNDAIISTLNNLVIVAGRQVSGYGSMGQVVTVDPKTQAVTIAADKDTTVGSGDVLYAQYTQASGAWNLIGW